MKNNSNMVQLDIIEFNMCMTLAYLTCYVLREIFVTFFTRFFIFRIWTNEKKRGKNEWDA